jgi:hypothetical protein
MAAIAAALTVYLAFRNDVAIELVRRVGQILIEESPYPTLTHVMTLSHVIKTMPTADRSRATLVSLAAAGFIRESCIVR